MSELQR